MSSLGRPDRDWQVRLLSGLIEAMATGKWFRFEDQLAEQEARRAGQLSATARLVPDADPKVLQLFALPEQEMLQRVLGYEDERGRWHPGEAGLTGPEGIAFCLACEGLDLTAIRDQLNPRRSKNGVPVLELKTVANYLAGARSKLRRLVAA